MTWPGIYVRPVAACEFEARPSFKHTMRDKRQRAKHLQMGMRLILFADYSGGRLTLFII
jgi:hypothetical protein